jgi:hypothetical protein
MLWQVVRGIRHTLERYAYALGFWDRLRFFIHAILLYLILSSVRKNKTELHFYPERPVPLYLTWYAAQATRARLKNGVGPRTMLFVDGTLIDQKLPEGHERWINGRCLDIRKSTVATVYEKVFGHKLVIDPTTHVGAAVRKSNFNATHDGYIVECPTDAEAGYVYQTLVDNTISGVPYVEDIRITVVGTEIPVVVLKRRPQQYRFWSANSSVLIKEVFEVLSDDEQAKVLEFSRHLGLDFGEIDAVRDRRSHKLYLIDANSTPMSPPMRLSLKKRLEIIHAIADSFARQFMS